MVPRLLFTNQTSQSASVVTSSRLSRRVRSRRGPELRGWRFYAAAPGFCFGPEDAGLAALWLLPLGGRHLGAQMSQWHHARGGWGQGHVFSGRRSAKKKRGNHVPER